MFVVFVLLLLYLCGLAVTNITYFNSEGAFYGLNPLPAFTDYLGTTMLLFVIFLILIFTSVSKSVFEKKKGIGFEIADKQEKGYSRWSKDKEIKNDKGVEIVDPLQQESQYAGIPLVNDGKRLWVDNGEYHNLVIGATGSGKSQTVVEPMVELLIKKGESMIITDPKGELYKAASVYMKERGYKVIILNFREPQNGNAWNPLTLPYQYYTANNKDKATELLDDVALNILYDPNNKGEPFWEKSAADYFSGLALGLFEDAKEEEINLNSINYMSTVGEDKFAASTFIKEYFTLKGEASNAYVFASNTINSPTDTKGGILSVFRQKIRLFASRVNLSEMLSYSDFDMRDIGKEKTAVFIVIQDEKTTYHGLATIFIKQCYETLIDVAQNNGGKLPYRTNFILDEFANMPPLKDVTTMVTAARSRDIRFTFIIQNFAQLKSVYGPENAETIKGNCGNLIYLISTELAALEEISKMCGEVKSDEKDKTASTPLVTVTDLQKLKLFEAIIIRWRLSPFKTKYTPNFMMDWGHEHIEGTYPVRKEKEVKLFDVKSFVKEKKRQKMMNDLDNNTSKSSSPFGGNPFGESKSDSFSPFGAPKDSAPLGGLGGSGFDLDAMMRDIDKKIAELDAEEARQKEEAKKKEEALKNNTTSEKTTDIASDLPKIETKNSTLPSNNDLLSSLPTKKEEPILSKNDSFDDILKSIDSFGFDSVSLPAKDNSVSEAAEEKQTFGNNLVRNDEVVLPKEVDLPLKSEVKEAKVEEVKPITDANDSLNHNYNILNNNKIENTNSFNIFSSSTEYKKPEINVNNDLSNIPVATSSPIEDDDFDFGTGLPKVENVDVLKPNYSSNNVKTVDNSENYNIYNTIPNIMETLKEDVKNASDIKNETDKFVDSIARSSISQDTMKESNERLNSNLNIYSQNVQPVSQEVLDTEKKVQPKIEVLDDKPNVNMSVEDVASDDNIISDDEFFDDFFGDD